MIDKTPIVITIGGTCENHCVFCDTKPTAPHYDSDAMRKKLKADRSKGKKNIVIEGLGTESIPFIIQAVADADAAGFKKIRVETNGIALAEAKHLRKLVAAGANEIAVLLPSADARTYSAITRNPKGFDSCLNGLANASMAPDVSVSVRIPVCAENSSSLKAILELAAEIGASKAILDISETFPSWPPEKKGEIMRRLRAATSAGLRLGISMSLKGHSVHQAATFADGRLDKGKEELPLLTYFSPGRAGKREVFSADFRVTRRCNQRCVFCAVNAECEDPSRDELFAAVDRLRNSNISRFCFEGGEPTLSPHLPELISRAASSGAREISLMTNGVAPSSIPLAEKIVAAGANRIFVSLHAHTPELSDSITRSPGTFLLTVQGIKNFISLGANTYIIFVMLPQNIESLPQFVRFSAKNFGRTPILLSMVTPYALPTLNASLIPSYTELAPNIAAAAEAAAKLKIPISAMEEQHRPPNCAPKGVRLLVRNLFSPVSDVSAAEGFTHPPRCAVCADSSVCPGVKDYYLRAHGDLELKPLKKKSKK